MKDRYDRMPGKEAAIANSRQKRLQSEHDDANAFVKKKQNELDSMAGRAPNLMQEAMCTNAYMTNNGMHAKEFGRELTSGLDKKAFPVR